MALVQIARYLPVVMPLFGGLAVLGGWRMQVIYRKQGRKQVERMLASRGETLVAIKDLPFSSVPVRTGLSSFTVFQIRARSAHGEEQTYEWAFEPRVFPWQTEGLKRCAHGVWIALA